MLPGSAAEASSCAAKQAVRGCMTKHDADDAADTHQRARILRRPPRPLALPRHARGVHLRVARRVHRAAPLVLRVIAHRCPVANVARHQHGAWLCRASCCLISMQAALFGECDCDVLARLSVAVRVRQLPLPVAGAVGGAHLAAQRALQQRRAARSHADAPRLDLHGDVARRSARWDSYEQLDSLRRLVPRVAGALARRRSASEAAQAARQQIEKRALPPQRVGIALVATSASAVHALTPRAFFARSRTRKPRSAEAAQRVSAKARAAAVLPRRAWQPVHHVLARGALVEGAPVERGAQRLNQLLLSREKLRDRRHGRSRRASACRASRFLRTRARACSSNTSPALYGVGGVY